MKSWLESWVSSGSGDLSPELLHCVISLSWWLVSVWWRMTGWMILCPPLLTPIRVKLGWGCCKLLLDVVLEMEISSILTWGSRWSLRPNCVFVRLSGKIRELHCCWKCTINIYLIKHFTALKGDSWQLKYFSLLVLSEVWLSFFLTWKVGIKMQNWNWAGLIGRMKKIPDKHIFSDIDKDMLDTFKSASI